MRARHAGERAVRAGVPHMAVARIVEANESPDLPRGMAMPVLDPCPARPVAFRADAGGQRSVIPAV